MASTSTYDVKFIEQPNVPFYASGTYAVDLDNKGNVYGFYNDSYFTGYQGDHGFVYNNGQFTTLGYVPSASSNVGIHGSGYIDKVAMVEIFIKGL